MKLEQIAIYDSIEGYMEQIPVIKVKKGEYITKRRSSRDGTPNKYYILNGQNKSLEQCRQQENLGG